MKTKVLWALVALNVLLLVGLIAPLGRNTARAQAPKQARASDHFLMLSGEANGANSALIYIIDESTNQLSARIYDGNPKTRNFIDMAPLDLDRIYASR